MENLQRIKALYLKYLDNNYTAEELDELLGYFYDADSRTELNLLIQRELESEDNGYESHPAVQSLLSRLDRELPIKLQEREVPVKISKFKWSYVAAAASVVIIFGLGILFYINGQDKVVSNDAIAAIDIAPGKNKATLLLPNGKVVNLSEAKASVVVASKLTYNDGTIVSPNEITHLTGEENKGFAQELVVSTPRGGSYQIVLADGTRVWLNAASRLKFPANFIHSNLRKVELIGEAYFEVAKNKNMPFIVKSGAQEVQVLGTHFNVNAYEDENCIRTTLTEGSVSVSANDAQVILVPNQQAIFSNGIKVREIDAENEIAWKNGDFVFEDDDLESIMRKVSRWYDVDVVYDEKIDKKMHFSGFVSRKKNISAVLKIMQTTGRVSFKMHERSITVSK